MWYFTLILDYVEKKREEIENGEQHKCMGFQM